MFLFYFFLVLGVTIFLQHWLHRHIQSFAYALTGNSGCAVRLLFYLLLPGVFLHEASHYMAARLLFVPVKRFDIGVGNPRSRRVSLGAVHVARTDPLRESLIGAAPFVGGVGAILMLSIWGFGLSTDSGLVIGQLLEGIRESAHDWTTWLLLYLIFAVSTAMIPSESDREPWGLALAIAGFGIAIMLLLGWTPQVPIDIVTAGRWIVEALTFALWIAAFVNGTVAVALWLLEHMVQQVSGKRVEFRVRK